MTKLSQIRMRDPFILEPTPGQYVLFGTTDENLWGGPGTGFDCYTSSDFENWAGPVAAFRPPTDFWADTQFWAPEVHAYQGRYFMFATFASSSPKLRGTAILVADQPTGPYLPWSDGPVTPHQLPCLDGTLFVDRENQPWVIYSRGAEATETSPALADGEMYARRLAADLRAAIGEPELLFRSSSAPWSRPLWFPPGAKPPEELGLAKDPLFTDGAFLVQTESALLMLWSAFGEAGYAMGVARSTTGLVTGPWEQNDFPLWAKNGGHGMILRRSDGVDLLVFHAPNDSPNERVAVAKVNIRDTDIQLA